MGLTWVMLPPRVLVRSQQPKSIRWRRLRPPRREGVAGVDEFRLKKYQINLYKQILCCSAIFTERFLPYTDPNQKFAIFIKVS